MGVAVTVTVTLLGSLSHVIVIGIVALEDCSVYVPEKDTVFVPETIVTLFVVSARFALLALLPDLPVMETLYVAPTVRPLSVLLQLLVPLALKVICLESLESAVFVTVMVMFTSLGTLFQLILTCRSAVSGCGFVYVPLKYT